MERITDRLFTGKIRTDEIHVFLLLLTVSSAMSCQSLLKVDQILIHYPEYCSYNVVSSPLLSTHTYTRTHTRTGTGERH